MIEKGGNYMAKKEDWKEKLKIIGTGVACITASALAIAVETVCLTKMKNRK